MAIFGIGTPKFTGTGIPDINTVTLDHTILDPDWNDPRIIEHPSVVSGKKTWITLGDYASFRVTVQLFKYTSPAAKFNTIITYLHQLVYFYPHKDGITAGDGLGKMIKNSANVGVKFFIIKISPYYLNNVDASQDLLDIEFISEDYIDITKIVQ